MHSFLKYLVLSSLLICFCSGVRGQINETTEIQVRPGDFLYGFGLGMNYSYLEINEASKIKPLARPFIGLTASYSHSYRWRTNASGLFSMRSSLADDFRVINQLGTEIQLYQQYKIDDLYLNFGLQSFLVFNNSSRLRGNSNFRFQEEQIDYSYPSSQLNPMIGFEFKLMDNWRFQTFYSQSLNGTNRNWQIGLSYRINKRNPPGESERSRRKRVAKRQIKELRDGALLVRLKTAKPTINAMRSKGFNRWAERTEKDQRIENLSIVNAFRNAYNFSELKFFYSHDSRKVRNGEFEGIFLNDSLEVDSNILLRNPENVFTCELTNIEQDTAQYFSHYELVQTGNFAFVQVPRFYGAGGNTFYSFVVKDQDFNQLSRPFPYYSRALFKSLKEHPGHGIFYLPLKLFFSDTPKGSVENLNRKLYKYWEKVER